jgi:hypothetical protein
MKTLRNLLVMAVAMALLAPFPAFAVNQTNRLNRLNKEMVKFEWGGLLSAVLSDLTSGNITSTSSVSIKSADGTAVTISADDGASATEDVVVVANNWSVNAAGNATITGTLTLGSGANIVSTSAGKFTKAGYLEGTGGTSLADPAASSVVTTTVTVTGAALGDYVVSCACTAAVITNEGTFSYAVTAADTVTVSYLSSAAHADPDGSGTWQCIVLKR